MPYVPISAIKYIKYLTDRYNTEKKTPKLVLFDSNGKLLVENYLPFLELKKDYGPHRMIKDLALGKIVPSLYRRHFEGVPAH